MNTYLVTHLADDSGVGTFSDAVVQVNAGLYDTIEFSPELNGKTVELPWIAIEHPVTILGNVTLNGAGCNLSTSDNLTLRGVSVNVSDCNSAISVGSSGKTVTLDGGVTVVGKSHFLFGILSDGEMLNCNLGENTRIVVKNSGGLYSYYSSFGISIFNSDSSVRNDIVLGDFAGTITVQDDSRAYGIYLDTYTEIPCNLIMGEFSGLLEIDSTQKKLYESSFSHDAFSLESFGFYGCNIVADRFSGTVRAAAKGIGAQVNKGENGYSDVSCETTAAGFSARNQILVKGDLSGLFEIGAQAGKAIGNGEKRWEMYAEANAFGLWVSDYAPAENLNGIFVGGKVDSTFYITAKSGILSRDGGLSWENSGGFAAAVSSYGSINGGSAEKILDFSGLTVVNADRVSLGIGAYAGLNISISGTVFAGNYRVLNSNSLTEVQQATRELGEMLADYRTHLNVLRTASQNGYAVADGVISTDSANMVDRNKDIAKDDSVLLKAGALVFGDIELLSGNNVVTIESGAALFGTIASNGNLKLNFQMAGALQSAPLIYADSLGSLDDSSTNYTVQCDQVESGTYVLMSCDEAFYADPGRRINFFYQGANYTFKVGQLGRFADGTTVRFDLNCGKVIQFSIGSSAEVKLVPVTYSSKTDGHSVQLDWKEVGGAANYIVEFSTEYDFSGDGEIRIVTEGAISNYTVSDLQEKTYYWRVKAVTANGTESAWSYGGAFTVEPDPVPVLLPYEMPQAEYMYGCIPTAIGMLMAYYDLYGYEGYSFGNLIEGRPELNARGTDGDPYDMDAFDTVLGNFIASPEYVDRFYGKTPEEEFANSFKDGGFEIRTDNWNCLADYLGTGQFWRNRVDLGTGYYFGSLREIQEMPQTITVKSGDLSRGIESKWTDFKYGLALYLTSRGYTPDVDLTRSVQVDSAGGSFTFEDYMAEIDAGRPVMISITGHAMIGYGYDKARREVIFDDTYQADQHMKWGSSYIYSGEAREMEAVTVIVLDTAGMTQNLNPPEWRFAPNVSLRGSSVTISWGTPDAWVGIKEYIVVIGENRYKAEKAHSFTVSKLDFGIYSCRVEAVDENGNVGISESVSFNHAGPSQVVVSVKTGKYSAVLKWSAAATPDKVKIGSYEVSVNGESRIVKGTSLTLKNLDVTTGNTVQVRAVDVLGRYGAWSEIRQFDIPDVTAPVLGKMTAEVKAYTANLSWSGEDNVGIVGYRVSCGGRTQSVAEESAVFENLAIGKYKATVFGVDAAENQSKTMSVSFTVKDVTAPETVTGLEIPTADANYTAQLQWTQGIDNSGKISYYEIQLDYGKVLKSSKTSIKVSKLAVGNHFYQVRAVDASKNYGLWSDAVEFEVQDRTAPAAMSVNAKVEGNALTLSWKAPKDNVGVTGYILQYGGIAEQIIELEAGQTSYTLTGLGKGVWQYQLTAVDAAGNRSKPKTGKATIKNELQAESNLSVPVSTLSFASVCVEHRMIGLPSGYSAPSRIHFGTGLLPGEFSGENRTRSMLLASPGF